MIITILILNELNNMKQKLNLTKIIFVLYILLLIWIILFKTASSFSEIPWFTGIRNINLIPFYYENNVGLLHIREVVMNILIFIPLGIYLKMLNVSGKKIFLYGCILSLTFELLQFVLAMGASDITDIISNTLGTVVGIFIYVLLRKLFTDKSKMDRIINVVALVLLILFSVLALLLFIAN